VFADVTRTGGQQRNTGVQHATSNRSLTLPPPTLYVFNAASIAKPYAIEQLTGELNGYDVDIAVISETHLKKKHADSCAEIGGYTLFA